MKVVVNRCFGGFSISHKATMELAKLKRLTLYPVVDHICKQVYKERATIDNPSCIVHYYTVPENEYEEIKKMDEKKRNYSESNKLYFDTYSIKRDDPDLIKVVESMGKESWGRHAELEIVEIPDGISWEIEEYDGMEHIAEAHRTW